MHWCITRIGTPRCHLSTSRFSSPSKVYDLTDGFHLPILNSALRAAGAGLFHAGVEVPEWRAGGQEAMQGILRVTAPWLIMIKLVFIRGAMTSCRQSWTRSCAVTGRWSSWPGDEGFSNILAGLIGPPSPSTAKISTILIRTWILEPMWVGIIESLRRWARLTSSSSISTTSWSLPFALTILGRFQSISLGVQSWYVIYIYIHIMIHINISRNYVLDDAMQGEWLMHGFILFPFPDIGTFWNLSYPVLASDNFFPGGESEHIMIYYTMRPWLEGAILSDQDQIFFVFFFLLWTIQSLRVMICQVAMTIAGIMGITIKARFGAGEYPYSFNGEPVGATRSY